MPALNNVDPYRYFSLKVKCLQVTVVPLTASLRMYGLMGGIYYNMIQDDPWVDPVPYKESNADSKFGLLAGVDIGLVAKRAFHAKPQFKVSEHSLDLISFRYLAMPMPLQSGSPPSYPMMKVLPYPHQHECQIDFKKEKVFDF